MAASSHIPRIFISHSHKDNDFGVRLVQDLRRLIGDESAVWYDSKGGLKGGDIWWPEISRELKRRNTFIVILSPNSLKSPWVKKEMRLALMYNVQRNKKIIPILYQTCKIPDDYQDIHAISFVSGRAYEDAFQELREALQINMISKNKAFTLPIEGYRGNTMQTLVQEVEEAYHKDDWPNVIRKVNAIARQYPEAVPPSLYRMQGWAYYFENQPSLAQIALKRGLKLMQDPQKQLTLLDVDTAQLVSNDQWNEVLVRANEALQLDPYNPIWQTAKIDALRKIRQNEISYPEPATLHSEGEDTPTETQIKNTDIEVERKGVSNESNDVKNKYLDEMLINSKLKEIELEKQYLTLKKEKFQVEKELMTFAFEMSERVATISKDVDSNTKTMLLRAFLSKFLENGEEN